MQELPVEILIKIFKLAASNQNLMFVCHRFYKIICEMEKYQHILNISNENLLLNTKTFSSIITSERKIDSIKLIVNMNYQFEFWQRLEAVILKFRDKIKILDITILQAAHNSSQLMNILHLLPQNCPKELKLNQCQLSTFARFLSHRDIEKLTIIRSIDDHTAFYNLNLTELSLIGPRCDVTKIVKTQRNLKHLRIVGDDNFYIDESILDLPHIESLDIPLFEINTITGTELIEKIHNLSSLKSLNFQSIASFAQKFCNSLIFPNIEDLDISILNELVTENSFDKLHENFPNLKSFSIRTGMALKVFRHLCLNSKINFESLLIENIHFGFVGITILPSIEFDIQQRGIKKLVLINRDRKIIICKNDLQKCLKLFPNLEYLVISGHFDTHTLLENLLKSMTKLKELVIVANGSHSTTYTMGVIKEYGTKLRLIVLENYQSACDVENLKIFFDGQFDVIIKRNLNLVFKEMGKIELKEFIC
ncbi:hypothetical protein PVAND_012624 [Polypedilum vanderplanki]|uniref:F-box domain-containing protein n=1 Tax=Polypedilum vanderplanki TaxID=319348 RepID=A0A9J6CM28_POLVA|nr:hypothetical protein PVAND_012624 [Polypedilum vanderplanki]